MLLWFSKSRLRDPFVHEERMNITHQDRVNIVHEGRVNKYVRLLARLLARPILGGIELKKRYSFGAASASFSSSSWPTRVQKSPSDSSPSR